MGNLRQVWLSATKYLGTVAELLAKSNVEPFAGDDRQNNI